MLREIEKSDWSGFFESFTLQHSRWLVSVDDERDTLPLEGIVSRDGHIVVTLGGDVRHHRRISIDAERVSVAQTGGVDEGLSIESKDGHLTRLRFRSPAAPELVDGVV